MTTYTSFNEIPRGAYDIVVADPPWSYASNSAAKPGRNPRRHYACMSDIEIRCLRVRDLVADDAILFMWTTAPMMFRAIGIPVWSWGFRYSTELIWAKDKIGTGMVARNKHESVLIYRLGTLPIPKPAPFVSLFEAPRGRHSEKPDTLQDRIDAVWPAARKLELFARRSRPGWDSFGNEVDG